MFNFTILAVSTTIEITKQISFFCFDISLLFIHILIVEFIRNSHQEESDAIATGNADLTSHSSHLTITNDNIVCYIFIPSPLSTGNKIVSNPSIVKPRFLSFYSKFVTQ